MEKAQELRDKAQEFKEKARQTMQKLNPFGSKFKGQGHRLGGGEAGAGGAPSSSLSSSSSSSSNSGSHGRRSLAAEGGSHRGPAEHSERGRKAQTPSENGRASLPRSMDSTPSNDVLHHHHPRYHHQASASRRAEVEADSSPYARGSEHEKEARSDVGVAFNNRADSGSSASTLQTSSTTPQPSVEALPSASDSHWDLISEEFQHAMAIFLSGMPSKETIQLLIKLWGNILSDPQSEKFRRFRMNNPRIQSTVCQAIGGVELLLSLGFETCSEINPKASEEEGKEEPWIELRDTSEQRLALIRQGMETLQQSLSEQPASLPSTSLSNHSTVNEKPSSSSSSVSHRKIDRQIRVFFPSSESSPSKIDIPDSFFVRTAAEVRAEATFQKQRLENSQILTTRAWKEKLATPKRHYDRTVIRIQYPDGYILQGTFLPTEPTFHLYQFAMEALKDQFVEFDLLHPIPGSATTIPRSGMKSGKQNIEIPTLQDAQLVPSSLLKFKLLNGQTFSGLSVEYKSLAQPLTSVAIPSSSANS